MYLKQVLSKEQENLSKFGIHTSISSLHLSIVMVEELLKVVYRHKLIHLIHFSKKGGNNKANELKIQAS